MSWSSLPAPNILCVILDIAAGASSGGLISKVLLANADALCAAASPLMDLDDSSLYVPNWLSLFVCFHLVICHILHGGFIVAWARLCLTTTKLQILEVVWDFLRRYGARLKISIGWHTVFLITSAYASLELF